MYLVSVLSVGKTESSQKINAAVLLITHGTFFKKVITDNPLCIGYKLWMCASLIVVMIIEKMRIIIAEHINISIGALIGGRVDLTI